MLLLLLLLTFSVLVANPQNTTLHGGGQSRSWSAEQRKQEKEKGWSVDVRYYHSYIIITVLSCTVLYKVFTTTL